MHETVSEIASRAPARSARKRAQAAKQVVFDALGVLTAVF
jgi:hypothetical protein